MSPPEVADRLDAAALDRLEHDAHRSRSFLMSPPDNGRVRLSGCLDVEAAAIVSAALDPLCSPRTRLATVPDADPGATDLERTDPVTADRRTAGQRRADALVEVCRLVLRTGDLPVSGGQPPQVTVTVGYERLRAELPTGHADPLRRLLLDAEPLDRQPPDRQPPDAEPPDGGDGRTDASGAGAVRRRFGVGTLGSGERVSPSTVRRLACDAGILPVVLGTQGQVLDVGRAKRLFDGYVRRALVARDRGCAFPGCDLSARWCESHHLRSWADGGPTSLDNAVLLCRRHHRLVHTADWTVRLGPDGLPEFIPPAHVDTHRRRRRNQYHRRT